VAVYTGDATSGAAAAPPTAPPADTQTPSKPSVPPLAALSGTLAGHKLLVFQPDHGSELTVVFATEPNPEAGGGEALGFAASYSCRDSCDGMDCGPHGACTHGTGAEAGVCACSGGYSGARCEVDTACEVPSHVDCGSHGGCEKGDCICEDGYGGTRCQTADHCVVAPVVDCGAHGQCDASSCMCSGGYGGARCTVAPDLCVYPATVECGAHGECEDGSYVCGHFWSGAHCEDADACEVPRVVDCGRHGECDDGSCVCAQFWSGTSCDEADACEVPSHVDCGAHGTCTDGTCACTSTGYSGAHCEIRVCLALTFEAGSVMVTNGGTYPSTATYACEGGVPPSDGDATRTCQIDGA
jgi:hypothetical protein